MGVDVKRGSFAANTVTGSQPITGIGFQPKAVIFMSANLTADGGGDDSHVMVGATDGTRQWVQSHINRNALANVGLSGSQDNTKCINVRLTGGAVDGEAAIVSLDADGFTINWTNAPVGAALIDYIAIGGSGFSAYAGITTVRTTLGTQAVTGVGFQPKALLLATQGLQTAPPAGTAGSIGIGFASGPSSSEMGSVTYGDATAAAQQQSTSAEMRKALCIATGNTTVLDWHIELDSFDSDGFTYEVTDAPAAGAADYFFYLALGGADLVAKVVEDSAKTTAGAQAKTGVGFQPKGLLALSRQNATTPDTIATITDNARMVMGMRDATSESYTWGASQDAADPTDTDRYHDRTKVLGFRDNARALLAEADVQSLDSDGYTLDWTTASGTAHHFFVLALGESSSGARTRLGMVL